MTPFWHQVRDQALHMLLGAAVAILWLVMVSAGANFHPAAGNWWTWLGITLAVLLGLIREVIQWPQLHTPEWDDSARDTLSWGIGATIATAIVVIVT